jgi:hypothetical protein
MIPAAQAAAMVAALTRQSWLKRPRGGKLVLVVEDGRRRWFGRRWATKLRWRDAKLLDLAEPELQALVNLARSRGPDRLIGSVRSLDAVPSHAAGGVPARSPKSAAKFDRTFRQPISV